MGSMRFLGELFWVWVLFGRSVSVILIQIVGQEIAFSRLISVKPSYETARAIQPAKVPIADDSCIFYHMAYVTTPRGQGRGLLRVKPDAILSQGEGQSLQTR